MVHLMLSCLSCAGLPDGARLLGLRGQAGACVGAHGGHARGVMVMGVMTESSQKGQDTERGRKHGVMNMGTLRG